MVYSLPLCTTVQTKVETMRRKCMPIGTVFGYLTVIGTDVEPYVVPSTGKKRYRVRVRCRCGREYDVTETNLRSGSVTSCGCRSAQRLRELRFRHGGTGTRLFRIWSAMRSRCYNPHNNRYASYGAKGVSVCAAWRTSFTKFREWAEKTGYDDSLTIDRKNLRRGYCPSNCQWIPNSRQAYNKTTSHMITFKGKTKCVAEWASELGFSQFTIHTRLKAGWSVEDALTIKSVKGGALGRSIRMAKADS